MTRPLWLGSCRIGRPCLLTSPTWPIPRNRARRRCGRPRTDRGAYASVRLFQEVEVGSWAEVWYPRSGQPASPVLTIPRNRFGRAAFGASGNPASVGPAPVGPRPSRTDDSAESV